MEKEKKQNIAIIAMSILILILIILIILILTGVINFNKSSEIDNNKMDNNIVENDVEDDEIDDNSTKEKEYLIITADSVRIRDKASTKGKILGTVNKKSKVELIDFNDGSSGNGCTDNWYKVLYKGNVGYVCGQYAVEEDEYVDTDLKNANKIKNTDVKNLLNIVRRTNSYDPNYLETSLSKMDGSVLLTIAIHSLGYVDNYMKEITSNTINEIIKKNSSFSEEDIGLLYRYFDYDSNKLFSKIKEIFNKEKDELVFDKNKLTCFNFSYISNMDIIYEMENCGGPAAYYTEIVQSYEEKDGSVIVITEIDSIINDVTDLEVDGMKLKYTFKKNSDGKYYVSEIEKYS